MAGVQRGGRGGVEREHDEITKHDHWDLDGRALHSHPPSYMYLPFVRWSRRLSLEIINDIAM